VERRLVSNRDHILTAVRILDHPRAIGRNSAVSNDDLPVQEVLSVYACPRCLGWDCFRHVVRPRHDMCESLLPQKTCCRSFVAVSGFSIGGVVFPIALSKMLKNEYLGFGWFVRIVGLYHLVHGIDRDSNCERATSSSSHSGSSS
jgi:hypothetical protein